MNRATALCVLIASSSACIEKSRDDEAFVKANLLDEAPDPKHVVNADLGGKVVYLGLDAPDEVTPGRPFTVIHYWKVMQPPGSEWNIFNHVEGRKRARAGSTPTPRGCARSTPPPSGSRAT